MNLFSKQPFSMNERAFLQKIREAFPIIGEGGIEICRVDRRERVIPVELSFLHFLANYVIKFSENVFSKTLFFLNVNNANA